MLGVAVAGWVVLPLPLAEVPEGHGGVGRHLGPALLLVHHQQLHHGQADGVVDAGVAVEAGRHRHDGQQVGFEPGAVELGHGLVSHKHDLQVTGCGHETPGPVVGWWRGEGRGQTQLIARSISFSSFYCSLKRPASCKTSGQEEQGSDSASYHRRLLLLHRVHIPTLTLLSVEKLCGWRKSVLG